MAEGYPDVSEPVIGLVVPEKEIDSGDVFDTLFAFFQISFDMLKHIHK